MLRFRQRDPVQPVPATTESAELRATGLALSAGAEDPGEFVVIQIVEEDCGHNMSYASGSEPLIVRLEVFVKFASVMLATAAAPWVVRRSDVAETGRATGDEIDAIAA